MKSLTPDPWIEASNSIKEGDIKEGIITRLKDFGAFVEISEGIEALLPQEEVLKYQNEHNTILEVGNKIETKIVKFNPTDKRISLSSDTKTPAAV